MTDKYDLSRVDAYDGELRRNTLDYEQFQSSSYAHEMRRRLEYYNGQQIRFDPSIQQDTVYGNTITPADWNHAISGYGWANIRNMLPQVTEEQCIHPDFVPFVRTMIDNRHVMYTVPPEKRALLIDGVVDEEQTLLYNKILASSNSDALADQFCKWVGLFGTAFQFIGWDPRYRRLVKRNLTPWQVYIVDDAESPGDLQHPNCLVAIAQNEAGFLDVGDSEDLVWQVWWQDKFWYETERGDYFRDITCKERGVNDNPYRDIEGNAVKPVIVQHSVDTDDIYYTTSDVLVQMNQRIDRDLTAISYSGEYQGFALFAVSGMDPSEIAAQPFAAGAAFAMPTGASAQFLHPLSPISEMLNAVTKKIRVFARMCGVDPEIVDSEIKQGSGVAKAQGRRIIVERREEEFPKWAPYEQEHYFVVSAVWNYYRGATKPLYEHLRFPDAASDSSFEVSVVFGDLEPTVDPLAEIYTALAKIKANLMTRAEFIQADRRVTRDVAMTIAEQIKNQNIADGVVTDFVPASVRLGQSGNRPVNKDRDTDKTGDTTTAYSGNKNVTPNGEG